MDWNKLGAAAILSAGVIFASVTIVAGIIYGINTLGAGFVFVPLGFFIFAAMTALFYGDMQ